MSTVKYIFNPFKNNFDPVTDKIALGSDVTGVLPIANGGSNNGSLAVTAGGTLYTDGSKIVNVGAGSAGEVLTSNGASAPTWQSSGGSSVTQNYWAGYYVCIPAWSVNSGTVADFSSNVQTLNTINSHGLGSFSQGAGGFPGFQPTGFTNGGVYKITASVIAYSSTATSDLILDLSDGTTNFAPHTLYITASLAQYKLEGIYTASSTNPIIRVRAKNASYTTYLGDGVQTVGINFTVNQIA